jgi:hypothetical protein
MIQSKTIQEFAAKFTEELVSFSMKTWGFDRDDIEPILRFLKSEKFKNSRGGRKTTAQGVKAFMNLAIGEAIYIANTKDNRKFFEYDHIASDPDIGEFYSSSWETHVAALIAHEFAHCLQFSFRTPTLFSESHGSQFVDNLQEEGHGRSWQFFYRTFRRNFVNGRTFNFKPEKKMTREWTTERKAFKLGTIIFYFDHKGQFLGKLYAKKGCFIQSFDMRKQEWVHLRTTSVVEARKMAIGI